MGIDDRHALNAGELGLNRGRKALVLGLMVLLGALGKTAVDFALRASSAPAAVVPAAVIVEDEPEMLRPLPPIPARRKKAARVAPPAQRVTAPQKPEVAAPIVAAAAPAWATAPAMTAAPVVAVQAPPMVEAIAPPPPPVPAPEAAKAVAPAAKTEVEVVPPPSAEEPALKLDGNGEEIARAIANAKRAAVQQCFERELKRSPELKGQVNVEMDLAPPQQVNSVRVTDDLDRPELTRCVTVAMQRLNFVGLNEEISVHVPYVLTARAK